MRDCGMWDKGIGLETSEVRGLGLGLEYLDAVKGVKLR